MKWRHLLDLIEEKGKSQGSKEMDVLVGLNSEQYKLCGCGQVEVAL